jgi:hypothetical protein
MRAESRGVAGRKAIRLSGSSKSNRSTFSGGIHSQNRRGITPCKQQSAAKSSILQPPI